MYLVFFGLIGLGLSEHLLCQVKSLSVVQNLMRMLEKKSLSMIDKAFYH
jgi:hypothetical protein